MADKDDFTQKLSALAARVAAELDADILLYSGDIERPHDDRVLDQCGPRRRRPNLLLMLSTYGGDAHAAYRIARCLQQRYKQFTVYIHGYCKSAGTLLAIGAHKLVMSDYAELGPLDVQLRKTDEVGERSSGLTPIQALSTLREKSMQHFRENFLELRFDMELPTKVALQMASRLAVGMFSKVYGQIDPIRLGEIDRAARIAVDYGQRLNAFSTNLEEDALAKLVAEYPSHQFVIDRAEAHTLFHQVREPTKEEEALALHIVGTMRRPISTRVPLIMYISEEHKEETHGAPSDEASGDGQARERPEGGESHRSDGEVRRSDS